MTLSLHGPTEKQIYLLENESLLKIQHGSWKLYETLANEDLKVEYIEDAIYIQSPASLKHEEIFRDMLVKISNYLEGRQLGKVIGSRFPIKLKNNDRAEPDIIYLSNEAIEHGSLTNTIFDGEPSWIIEIISPNYREHDTITKRKEYQQLNVQEYWIIDSEYKTIEIMNFKNEKEIRRETITKGKITPRIDGLEGLKIDIEEIFK
jgi:Uma2 family endonuclease